MSVTAALVKELREKSGAGMMDCKKALGETGGDMDAAIDWLRTKGLATAAKKSGRVAAEGLVAIAVDGPKGAVVELNAETDFVARYFEMHPPISGDGYIAKSINDFKIRKYNSAKESYKTAWHKMRLSKEARDKFIQYCSLCISKKDRLA